jgi:hypothetical protein
MWYARLREFNREMGCLMRTYVSTSSRRYQAGDATTPSAWRAVPLEDLAELREIPQFELREFADSAALDALIAEEQLTRLRQGLLAYPAEVLPIERPPDPVDLRQRLAAIAAPSPPDPSSPTAAVSASSAAIVEAPVRHYVAPPAAPAPPAPDPPVPRAPRRPGMRPPEQSGAPLRSTPRRRA